MGANTISRRKPLQANIGVFGVGYWKYWDQFDGLLDELITKQKKFIEKLMASDVHIIDFGMVDDAQGACRLPTWI
jgi:L-arabinose isomerase